MENNINTLDELNKGCYMGMTALDFIIEKVDEFSFKELIERKVMFKELIEKQYKEYMELSNRIDELYREYTDEAIHEASVMDKVMTWYGIQKDTILDDSVSKIADLLINGTNMGIIEGRKLLNNKTMDKKVHKLCSEYVKVQEKYIERLKKFL